MSSDQCLFGIPYTCTDHRFKMPSLNSRVLFPTAGTTQGRGPHAIPREEALFRRVPVHEMQEEMDERELVGQLRPGVHQMPHQRVSTQAGPCLYPSNCESGS